MFPRLALTTGLAAIAGAVSSVASVADEALPGVQPPKPIVQPAPESESDEALQADEDGWIINGNTRVKVSGSITIEAGGSSGPADKSPLRR